MRVRAVVSFLPVFLPVLGLQGCNSLPSQQPAATPAQTAASAPTVPQVAVSVAPAATETPTQPVQPAPEATRSFAGGGGSHGGHSARPPRDSSPGEMREPPTPRPTRAPKASRQVFQQATPDLSGPPIDDAPTPEPTKVAVAGPITPDLPVVAPAGSMEMSLPQPTKPLALTKVRVSQSDEGLVLELDVSGDVPRHRVFRLQNPGRIVVDLEDTEVPGGAAGPKAGTSPVKEVKANELGAASGNQVARVQFILDSDTAIQAKPSEETDGHTLRVSFKPRH